MDMKIENWDGHKIRFVEKEPGDWWAVGTDVCKALGLKQVTRAMKGLPEGGVTISKAIDSIGRTQDVNIISEKSIYALTFKSRKKEALKFQDWVYEIIKTLRQSTGLEGFQIFRMLDKQHQREAMDNLKTGLANPAKVDYIKANTIANKAVSTQHGYLKMLKKGDMSPDMLVERQQILDETVNLMAVSENFELSLPIAATIYGKYCNN
jgi:prophage antirepressor-like protein